MPTGRAAQAEPAAGAADTRTKRTFTLSSMMLVIALIAVCLGLMRESFGMGIGLAMLCTPALIRASITARRRESSGRPMIFAEKVLAFLGGLGVVALTGVAAAVAFYATCWVGFIGGAAAAGTFARGGYDSINWGFTAGIASGAVVGLIVLVLLAIRFWPPRKPR